MERREFIKTTLAASAFAAGIKTAHAAAPAAPSGRDYYELRVYRLKPGASHTLLDGYLEKALIPALNRRGIPNVGVFMNTEPKDGPAITVLIPYSSLETFAGVAADVNSDPVVQQAGADYLQTPTKDNPAFDRIDSWLLLAFTGMPRMELPSYSRARQPRIFEIRTYESFSEAKALKKIEMFNSGEIGVQHEVGLAPVIYGQALVGSNLPHLTYITSATDRAAHKRHWSVFSKHPVWVGLKTDPQYADTVSKITSIFVAPTAYSQI